MAALGFGGKRDELRGVMDDQHGTIIELLSFGVGRGRKVNLPRARYTLKYTW